MHVIREFALKEIALVPYRTAVQKLIQIFFKYSIWSTPRSYDKHVDALATLSSKVVVPDKAVDVKIIRKM